MIKQKLNSLKDNLKNSIRKILTDQDKSMLALALLVSLAFSLSIQQMKPKDNNNVPEYLRENLDVFLPADHVLYPVEVDNYEAIDSLIGATAFVRVYNVETGKPIAKNVKILRAPKAPDQLAFLIPVNIAKLLVREGPVFRLAVQRKTNAKAVMTNKAKLNKKTLTTYGS